MNTIAFFCGLAIGAVVAGILFGCLLWQLTLLKDDEADNPEYYDEIND